MCGGPLVVGRSELKVLFVSSRVGLGPEAKSFGIMLKLIPLDHLEERVQHRISRDIVM